MKRVLSVVLVGSLASCTPAWYRDAADSQANRLIGDREEKTLGYKPQVDVGKEIPKVPKQAYARIPTSPPPPPTTAPVSWDGAQLPRESLGPDLRWMDAAPVEGEPAGAEVLEQRANASFPGFMGPPTAEEFYRRYELFGLLEYAVNNSRNYRDQMDNLYLAALNVTLERHLLSPRPFVHQDFTYNGGQRDVDYRAALTAATSAGVRQKLPYGGEIVAQTLVTFVNGLTENAAGSESAQLVLSGTIPLLRGAGMVNLEGLISAERELVYQVRSFEQYRRNFVVTIASSYFNLLAQQQSVANRRTNLTSLTLLTERTQALYDAKRVTFLDVQRALQSQLFAQSSLIDAEERYAAALDDFKVIIGMPVNEPLVIVPVELKVEMPRMGSEEAIAMAMRYRLDLRTASDRIEDAQRGVSNAENGLLPDVDLAAKGTIGNEPDSPAVAIDNRTATYSAGVGIDLPIDRVAERNIFRRSLIGFYQAQRSFITLRDQIEAQVRDSLRAIRAADASLRIQRRSIELAERRVELANDLLKLGRGETRDVVEAQSSLLEAQDQYEQARTQLQVRILQFMRDTGTLRVDPKAGAIGEAMDRTQHAANSVE